MYQSFLRGCFCLFFLLLSISCDRGREVRKYQKEETSAEETTVKPSGMETHATPARMHFSWDTPQGWSREQKTSGMRLAAFSIKSQDKESLCTIIPLKGAAGGIRANVMRWLGQINVNMEPGSEKLEKFLSAGEDFRTKGGFPAVMIDFTTITPRPEDRSILATVITLQDSTIFIKMTGEKSHLVENKEKFKALSKSFTIKSGK